MGIAVTVERPALGFELELVEVSGLDVAAERVLGRGLLLRLERVLRTDSEDKVPQISVKFELHFLCLSSRNISQV